MHNTNDMYGFVGVTLRTEVIIGNLPGGGGGGGGGGGESELNNF